MLNISKIKIAKDDVLLFDLDGTIAYTNIANNLSYKEAIRDVLKVSLSYNDSIRLTQKEIKKFFPNLSENIYNDIKRVKDLAYSRYLDTIELNYDLLQLIEHYSKTNKIVLATNSGSIRANLILKHFNMSGLFDYIFCKEDYMTDSKYESVIKILNIDPNRIVIFENEKTEILKAINMTVPYKNIAYLVA